MIIAVLGEKGGTGKTTVAVNLAGMRAAAGWRVLLLDADRQGSSAYWAQKRETMELPAVHWDQYFGASLARALQSATLDYDDVIVDIGAGDSDEMGAALEVAGCAITPVRPSGIDVWTMGLMDARMSDAQLVNESLQCWAVINCASTHPASSGRRACEGSPGRRRSSQSRRDCDSPARCLPESGGGRKDRGGRAHGVAEGDRRNNGTVPSGFQRMGRST